MATNAQINVTANTSAAERAVEALFKKDYNLNVNIKGGQPLGRITGDLSELDKSLAAANARVIAFGASASVVMAMEKAFHSLVDSTIEVQKAFNQIQAILNVSDKDINKFGSSLFNVAKQTGQSFETVAEAATLLSRQGLGMEETLKRTNDALVLSRITGMDAAQSVQALTAAVNSFSSQAVTATEVVNKFATVDTQFAIGAKDLPEAIGRVGSSAAQAGVSLDQLIGLVTAAQVATARGGAVIGNSFKTIFTRLDRPKTASLLEGLGIGTKDAEGKAKGTIELLQELAKSYDTLSKPQQAQVAEKVGGVFQINILKATLADLNKEYSVYNNALKISQGATDDAYKRNEQLNQTYAAQLNALKLNATQLSANVGEKLFGPSLKELIGGGNSLLGSINESDSNTMGAKLANGILSGLGQALSGPGLALIGGVLIKLVSDFSKFALTGTKDLLGLNNAAKQQEDIQKSITEILSRDPSIYTKIASGAMSVNDVTKQILINLKEQTEQLELQAKLSAEIASQAYGGGARVVGGIARTTRAAGYIPNFSSDEDIEEAQARMLGAKNPRAKEGRGTIGGRKFLMNSEEDEIPNFGANGDSAVIPRYAGGWVPNFAGRPAKRKRQSDVTLSENNEKRKMAGAPIDLGFTNAISLIYAQKAGIGTATGTYEDPKTFKKYILSFNKAGLALPIDPDEANLEKRVTDSFISETNGYISSLGSSAKISSISQFANAGAVNAMLGNIFETAVTYAAGMGGESRKGGQVAAIDFPNPNQRLRNLFHNTPGQYEAKYNDGRELVNDVVKKAIKEGLVRTGNASGYIPALNNSVSREMRAGAPSGSIYVKQYAELQGTDNPLGLGVFNTRDEGSASKEQSAIRRKGYATGYIPNFADESSSGIGASLGAVSSELLLFGTMLGFSTKGIGEEYRKQISQISGNVSAMQKFETAVRVGGEKLGFAISALAPILTQTISNAIPQDTKGGRTGASAVNTIGDIASFGGAGAAFGPWGAAIGAATGAIIGLTKVINQATTDIPEFTAAEKKSSEEKTKILREQNEIMPLVEQLREAEPGSELAKKLKSAITDALPNDPETLSKIQAANYNFEAVKEIFVKEATIITDKNKQDTTATRLQSLIEKGKPGFMERAMLSQSEEGVNELLKKMDNNPMSKEIGKEMARTIAQQSGLNLSSEKNLDTLIENVNKASGLEGIEKLGGEAFNKAIKESLSGAGINIEQLRAGIIEKYQADKAEIQKAETSKKKFEETGGKIDPEFLKLQKKSVENFFSSTGFLGAAESQSIKNTLPDAKSLSKQIDDLIKDTLAGIDKVGGGIKNLFDKDNPFKSGEAIRAAVKETGTAGGQIGTGQRALSIADSINALTGGLPIFSEKGSIFKDVSSGVLQSLEGNFNIAKNSLAPNQYQEIIDAIQKATGVKGVTYNGTPAGLQSIAQLQAAKALGLKDQDTELGRKLYSQVVDSALKKIESSGKEGKELAKTYKMSAAAVGTDPVANGVFGLQTIAQQQLEELKKFNESPNIARNNAGVNSTSSAGAYSPTFNINASSPDTRQLFAQLIPELDKRIQSAIADISAKMDNLSKQNPSIYGAPQNNKAAYT